MSKTNQPIGDDWPDTTEGNVDAPYSARTALLDAIEEQKAQYVASSIQAFNMGLRSAHEEDMKMQLSEFDDDEIFAEYHRRMEGMPF